MTRLQEVVDALAELGGVASNREIFDQVERRRPGTPRKEVEATVRQQLVDNSPDSVSHRAGRDIFGKVGRARWKLLVAATISKELVDTDRSGAIDRGDFEATNPEDARRRIARSIALRQGQPAFRDALLRAYGGRCAISACDAIDALEAAHIRPYRGERTNHPQNGLLLRADLHTLFDRGLIAIDPSAFSVLLAPSLARSAYAALAGKRISLPSDASLHPSTKALERHRADSGL